MTHQQFRNAIRIPQAVETGDGTHDAVATVRTNPAGTYIVEIEAIGISPPVVCYLHNAVLNYCLLMQPMEADEDEGFL